MADVSVKAAKFSPFKTLEKTPTPLGEQGTWLDAAGTIWLSQAKGGRGSSEDTLIHRYDKMGKHTGDKPMRLLSFGHGTTFFVDAAGRIVCNANTADLSGNVVIKRDLVAVPFQPGRSVSRNDPSVTVLETGSNRYAVPSAFLPADLLVLRESATGGDVFRVLLWSSVLAGKPVEIVRFGPVVTSTRAFQGVSVGGDANSPVVWILFGHTNGLAAHRAGKFDPYAVDEYRCATDSAGVKTMRLVASKNFQGDILAWNRRIETEPAGIQNHPTQGLLGGVKLDYHVDSERYIGIFQLAPLKKNCDAEICDNATQGDLMVWTKYAAPIHVAASLNELERQYTAKFPNRPKASDGALGNASHAARASDHNPAWGATGADHAVIRAVDLTTSGFTTADKDKVSLSENEQRELIAALIRREKANKVDRIHYIIHRFPGDKHTYIWSRTTQWRPIVYGQERSMPHDHHFHTSLEHSHAAYNDTSVWFDWNVPDVPPVVAKIVIAGKEYDDIPSVSVQYVNDARKSGKFSRNVWYVQSWLNTVGATLTADGFWGAVTQAAFDKFRRNVLKYKGADALGEVGLGSLSGLAKAAKVAKKVQAK